MPRTTVNIDASVLAELKQLSMESGRPLGQLISELVAQALARRGQTDPKARFEWKSQSMGQPSVPLEDKQSVYA
jgi:hypothetical protein